MGKDRAFLPFLVRDADEPHRASTQLELFFDLVTVVAIAALTTSMHHQIAEGHGLAALFTFGLGFFSLWWVWIYFTWFSSLFDNGDWVFGLISLMMMTGFAIFAGGVEYMLATNDYAVGLVGWVVMRLALITLLLRAIRHNPGMARQLWLFIIAIVVLQTLWVLSNLLGLSGDQINLVSLVLIAAEMAVPVLLMCRKPLPFHREHLTERFGLLNIIVLGEGVLSVAYIFGALHGGEARLELIVAGLSAMVIVSQMWWIYFQDSDRHLASGRPFHVLWWSYIHIFIYAAAAILGAGLSAVLDGLTHHAHAPMQKILWFVTGPVATYFIALWLARDLFLPLGWQKAVLPLASAVLLALSLSGAPIWLLALTVFIASVLRTTAISTPQFQEEG